MSVRLNYSLIWHELHWQRPLTSAGVEQLLRLWVGDPFQPKLVLELRAEPQGTRWLLAAPRNRAASIQRSVTNCLPGTVITDVAAPRLTPTSAARLRLSTRFRALRTTDPQAVSTALLKAVHDVVGGEELIVQLIVGARHGARAVSVGQRSSAPREGASQNREATAARRLKHAEPGFDCLLRLGVRATTEPRQRSLLAQLYAAIRTSEAPDAHWFLRPEHSARLDQADSPWLWWTPLNIAELVGLLGWPLGDDDLPGVPSMHPKPLPPPSGLSRDPERIIGQATARGHDRPVGMSTGSALHHTWVIGPTGVGKSTLLLNFVLQDLTAGRGVVLIEPKGDLVDAVLARVPDKRLDDVVVLDPTDDAPVGLNPLHGATSEQSRVDGLVAVFRALNADSWGPRTQDILHACLLSLVRAGDSCLAMVPMLLTNAGFRRQVVQRVGADDPIALGPFWAWYEALSDAERGAAIAPVMNKLRAFLLSPALRGVLGQVRPKLDIAEMMSSGKVLLVPLRKGILGSGTASLIGSLVVAQLWQASLARSSQDSSKRRPVLVYIDEVQDYLHLPTDLGDALAQARGLGIGFTLAHQHLGQLSHELQAGLLSNCRSCVCFQLPHDDAAVMAKGHPELSADDFTALDAFHAYASLFTGGRVMPYTAARTLPQPAAVRPMEDIRRLSRQRYGQPRDKTEAVLRQLLRVEPVTTADTSSGRRRRTS